MAARIDSGTSVEDWLDGLVKISRRIARMEDVDNAFTEILPITRELIDSDTASLGLLESRDQLILKYQATERGCGQLQNEWIQSPELWKAITSACAYRHPEDTHSPEFRWPCKDAVYAVQAAAVVPLILDDSAIGVLWVGRYSRTSFTPADLARLGSLADQAVIALEHASMAARLQSLAVIEERSRIAREMHDSLAQILGYLGLEMQTLEALTLQGNREAVLAELKQARQIIKSAQVDVRGNILSLRTTLAGGVDLTESIQKYVDEFEVQTGIATRLIDDCDVALTLSPLAETQLVRIVQEGLTNVRKHARATSVDLCLAIRDQKLYVTLSDNGIGLQSTSSDGHFGLQTMRERAESVGGTLTISSVPAQGTTIALVLPLL
ncbi:MAG: GAF domain-containing sensor histidine kinase [Chloroflexi bacterium]|nr:GAF domain-containing sensor histidine kinase [Chloroflexota bacterium]